MAKEGVKVYVAKINYEIKNKRAETKIVSHPFARKEIGTDIKEQIDTFF